jgi:hypothetical protein
MFNFRGLGRALARGFRSSGGARIQLNPAAQKVIQEAEARGYSVTRSTRQGNEAVVIDRGTSGAVHLWSNDDIVAYGRSMHWL